MKHDHHLVLEYFLYYVASVVASALYLKGEQNRSLMVCVRGGARGRGHAGGQSRLQPLQSKVSIFVFVFFVPPIILTQCGGRWMPSFLLFHLLRLSYTSSSQMFPGSCELQVAAQLN